MQLASHLCDNRRNVRMNPAFIAQQLGNTVQMLLSTYARWIKIRLRLERIAKLEIGIKSVSG
ncbi:integrase [Pseudomonas nicosulfuronedens]